jgi:molybdate transport system substrate-binding protein
MAPDREEAMTTPFAVISRRVVLGLAGALALTGLAQAAEIKVMSSGGFTAAYQALLPAFEKETGHKVDTALGPSMGTAPDAIPVRLERGEPVDVLIMVGSALGDLIRQGKVVPESRVDLANSKIAMAVRAGAPKPDIGTLEAFRRVLLEAKSIAYSDSASGVYIENEMYKRLGLENELKGKSRMIVSERVGNVVARGEAEVGFQQVSELLPIKGIEYVGPIPDEVQKVTVFSAGIPVTAKEPAAAKALIDYLGSEAARPTVIKTGLEPIHGGKQ